ncbi:MAG: hypothetical protein MZU95_01775 [Desulfomicrobium escambiense]|nr:hypothetical protein [Desulfomicrobium escambiense]
MAYLLIWRQIFRTRRSSSSLSSQRLTQNSMIHEEMLRFFDGFPPTAHPMAILATMVVTPCLSITRIITREDFQAERFDLMAASSDIAESGPLPRILISTASVSRTFYPKRRSRNTRIEFPLYDVRQPSSIHTFRTPTSKEPSPRC